MEVMECVTGTILVAAHLERYLCVTCSLKYKSPHKLSYIIVLGIRDTQKQYP